MPIPKDMHKWETSYLWENDLQSTLSETVTWMRNNCLPTTRVQFSLSAHTNTYRLNKCVCSVIVSVYVSAATSDGLWILALLRRCLLGQFHRVLLQHNFNWETWTWIKSNAIYDVYIMKQWHMDCPSAHAPYGASDAWTSRWKFFLDKFKHYYQACKSVLQLTLTLDSLGVDLSF